MEINAKELFDRYVFPAFLSRLKTLKTREYYKKAKEYMELMCGKPFLLLNADDGDYFAQILKNEISPTTAYVRLGYIRSIANFTEKNAGELLSGTPFCNYSSPFAFIRKSFNHSDYVDESRVPVPKQINRFLECVNDEVRLITSLILKCGFSSRNLISLRYDDIKVDEQDNKYVLVMENGVSRYVYLPHDVFSLLETYVLTHGLSIEGCVLKNRNGKKLSERVIEIHYKKQADLYNFSYSMQDLRNASAAYMLAGGASREDVANILGISQKWNNRFDLCQDKISTFKASSYSLLDVKPYNFGKMK